MLHERMKTMHPDKIEKKNFLGLERADGIKTSEIYNIVENEVKRGLKIITKTKLNDKILMKVINTKMIAFAVYLRIVCKLNN